MALNKFRLNSTVWIDVLLNVLGGIFGILFLIYLLINEPTETKKIDAVAEVIITADWPNEIGNDIDLWILMPHNRAVGYIRPQDAEVSLERDDLGHREVVSRAVDMPTVIISIPALIVPTSLGSMPTKAKENM